MRLYRTLDLGMVDPSGGDDNVVVARTADASARSRDQLGRRQARIGEQYPGIASYAHHMTDWAARTVGMPADPGPRVPLADELRDLMPRVDGFGSPEIRKLFSELQDTAWLHACDAWVYATMRQALAERAGTTGQEVIDSYGKAEASRTTLYAAARKTLDQVNVELAERAQEKSPTHSGASHHG